MKKFQIVAVLLLIFSLIVGGTSAQDQSIVEIAAGNEDFATLVSLVQAAGLVDALSGEGPLTVFAPTNDAFAAVPQVVVDFLLANPAVLTQVLTYHVVPGAVLSTELSSGEVATLQGATVDVKVSDMGVEINNASVVAADIVASNGVIHVIDAVLLPKAVLAALTGQTLPSGYAYYDVPAVAGSGVSGSVLIVDMGRGTSHVQVRLDGTPAGGDHPVHFHAGRCGSAGAVVVPLANVDGDLGWSTTRLDVPFTWIVGASHALMVHLAPDQMSTIVACGDVGID